MPASAQRRDQEGHRVQDPWAAGRIMRYLGGAAREAGVTLLVVGAYGKCSGPAGCGATLKTKTDAQLHYCDLLLTTKRGMRDPGTMLGISSRNALL